MLFNFEFSMNDQAEKTKNFFDNLAPNWDEMVKVDPEKIELILGLADIKEDEKILDLATGTGILIPYLLERDPKSITAIDISPKMIEIAQGKLDQNNIEYKSVDFYDFDGGDYDLVVCYQAYPHFKKKKEFIEKLANVLKPGGRFIIAHPDSRDTINNRHTGKKVKKVSDGLLSAKVESALFSTHFKIDTLVDSDELYIISGTKKKLC